MGKHDKLTELGSIGIGYKNWLYIRTSVIKAGCKDIERHYCHPEVCTRYFYEHVPGIYLHFANLPAVDNRREREHTAHSISQNRVTGERFDDTTVLKSFWVTFKNLGERQFLFHAEWGKRY